MSKIFNIISFSRLFKSFGYAAQGIAFALKTQQNARLHLLATIIVCLSGLWLHVTANDWRWLIGCITLVWFSEIMNTAFEHICDVVMPELHISVKRAKDVAAGAVLICVIGATIIGMLTLFPYLTS